MKKSEEWGRRLAAVVFPERCIFCNDTIPPLTLSCDTCRAQVHPIAPPLCAFCGMNREHCECRHHRHRFDRIVAPFYCDNETAVHRGILRLKRHDDPLAIRFFAEQMAAVVRREYGEECPDAVTFVPMTAADIREREYNQGKLLAKALAKQLQLPLLSALTKCYATKPQKKLNAVQRAGNVLGAFTVNPQVNVAGKTLLLVDDVFTTGATVDECAKMLKLYGARRVLCATAAIRRLEKNKDRSAEDTVDAHASN